MVGSVILTDKIHLVSDTSLDELHLFAKRIGMKRSWFQGRFFHPHYDLTTTSMANKAIRYGAAVVSSKELSRRMVRK